MECMKRRKVTISLLLVTILIALNITSLDGGLIRPERKLVEIGKESGSTPQSDDTVRIDPLKNFKKYRGGYDITDKHYWGSTIFTGIYGYAIAVVWLLCGLGYGLFLLASTFCCKRNHRKLKKRSTCHYKHDGCYLWLIISAIFLTILAITATGLVLGGNAKFHSRTNKVVDIIIDTADGASETIYTTTEAMREMNSGLEGTDIGQEASNFLIPTSTSLNSQADDIHREARKNRRLIDKLLKIVYIVTTVVISLNLVALIALSAFGILKFRRTLKLLIALCWIFTTLCWFLFGIFYFLDNFAGDTCTALESFQSDPYNSSLSSILPCDELLSTESVLHDVSQGVYQIVNEVNERLSTEYGNVAQICNPFSGPPEYNYEPGNCSSTSIRVGDIPRIFKMLTCTDPNCKGGVMISPRDFNTVEAYTTAVQKILDVYPGMENLTQCDTVFNAFNDIIDKHCKPLEKSAHLVWGGLVFLSVVMVVLVLVWSFEAHHEENHNNLNSSVKPHSAEADRLELGAGKEANTGSNSVCHVNISD
ncbi:putative protein SHORT-ROOT-like [Capsicum annuum]|uniref:uncharacterized protein LOC107847929 n=1 Tax=Capsicum annuum TaxID=4072 RepID=UPI0007BF02E7|nr:uncharacterized protein LOC107847929 [Capsicum annuum]KAF3628892.1 putative protein SHORT-ROOT-like [Capsicum annuum]KAF3653116.1 putative protein SHORT-ROOT-like [Capsicum annuum]